MNTHVLKCSNIVVHYDIPINFYLYILMDLHAVMNWWYVPMYLHAFVLGVPMYSFTPMLLKVLEYTHAPLCMSTHLYTIICLYALICTHVLECTYSRIHTYILVYLCSYFDVCVRLCTCIPACPNAYTRLNFCTYLRNTHVRTDVYTYK